MKLLLDLGNTRLKWALWDGQRLQPMQACRLEQISILPTAESALLASSSADPQRLQRLQLLLDAAAITRVQRLGPAQSDALLTLAYADPATLGIDRWLAMRAARAASSDACLIVSVGTALTVDAVDYLGQHLGGSIVAGPSTMRDALLARAAHLPGRAGELQQWASNTVDAVYSGPVLACAALIERMYRDLAKRSVAAPRVLMTGGGADALLPALGIEVQCIPDLVLRGMLGFV